MFIILFSKTRDNKKLKNNMVKITMFNLKDIIYNDNYFGLDQEN